MKKYSYKAVDNGLLSPLFYSRLILPIIKMLPSSLSPNLITFISFIFSTLGLFSALYFGHSVVGILSTSLCYFLYVLCDCLDGAYARYHQKETALGDFLDHFHDIYAIGTFLICFFSFFHIHSPLVIILALIAAYIYASERFHLLYHTGHMVFPKFASWEPALFTIGLFLVSLIPGVHAFLLSPAIQNLSWIELLLLLASGTHLTLSSKNIRKAILEQIGFVHYSGLSASFHYLMPNLAHHQILSLIIVYNLDFIGKIISKRLTADSYPKPDFIAPLILLLGPSSLPVYELAIAYLAAKVCTHFFKTVSTLQTVPGNESL